MNILHVADVRYSRSNGVINALRLYLKYEFEDNNVSLFSTGDRINVDNINEYNWENYHSLLDLPHPFNKPDIVIFNEVYKIKYIKLYKECKKNNIPFIIIPHGSLVKQAQNTKKIKKTIANLFFFKKFMQTANCIQFLNIDEQENSSFKFKNTIISGNGVERPEETNFVNNSDIVYIGRYSIHTKGLDLIAQTCKEHKKWFEDENIKIKMYGRTNVKDYENFKKIIGEYGLENIIILNGEIYGEEKRIILCESYVFMQVSRHEGQPMGILEALSTGLPCVATYGTNFGEYINENKCGIGIKFDKNQLFKAIKLLYENREIRDVYSQNAIKCVNDDYNIKCIIDNLIIKYNEIINKSKKKSG